MDLVHSKRLAAEFYGTFMFTLTITLAVTIAVPGGVPYAIGFGLVVLVYLTGPVSGGQLNPSVTAALMIRGKLDTFQGITCMAVQLAAGLCGGTVGFLIQGGDQWSNTGYPKVEDGRLQAFVGEMMQTFALVTAVLGTATTKAHDNRGMHGLSIGFVVFAGAVTLGGDTGGCFNPAVSMLTLLHGDWADMPVYFCGPLLGGILAALVFHITNPGEFDDNHPILSLFGLSNKPEKHEHTRRLSAYTMEFIGTFFLAWTVALSTNANPAFSGAVAIGAMLMSMVYAGGHVSGAHYNPCVTLGVYLRGKNLEQPLIDGMDAGIYMIIQIVAALCAAALAGYVNDGTSMLAAPGVGSGHTKLAAFFVEFLFSGMLVTAVLSSTAAELSPVNGNNYFGMNIGWTVLVAALAVGPISGGVFNPALGIALPLVTNKHTDMIYIYVLAAFLGSVLGAAQVSLWVKGCDAPTAAADDVHAVTAGAARISICAPSGDRDRLAHELESETGVSMSSPGVSMDQQEKTTANPMTSGVTANENL